MRQYHIPIFVPHLGCPHDCAFCNQKHITGQQKEPHAADVTRMISQALSTFKETEYYAEVAFFGGSFTAIEDTWQEELLQAAYPFVQSGQIQGIRCSTRPDAITEPILERLKGYGVTCIELGVQSMDEEVLKAAHRGHTSEDVYRAAALIREYGIDLGLQMMTGLPGDTAQKDRQTAQKLAAMHPACVRIYPTLVIADTMLCDWYRAGSYVPQTLQEAVAICAELYDLFAQENIPIIRLGLMASDEICETSPEVVAGPCHSSFGELVRSRVLLPQLVKSAQKMDSHMVIFLHPKELSMGIGHRKSNKIYLENLWHMPVRFVADETKKPYLPF